MPSPPHTTRASTPSATHCRARSSASSASRPWRLRTARPAPRSRGERPLAGPGALALARRRVGQEGDLPCSARAQTTGRSRASGTNGTSSTRRGRTLGAAGAGRRTTPGRRRRPWPARPTASRAVSASIREPGTARSTVAVRRRPEHLAVPPHLVGPDPHRVRGDRLGVGVVDRQQVARQRLPARAPSGAPATRWPVSRPRSASQVTSRLPQPVGQVEGVRPRRTTAARAAGSQRGHSRRDLVVGPLVGAMVLPATADPVEDPGR